MGHRDAAVAPAVHHDGRAAGGRLDAGQGPLGLKMPRNLHSEIDLQAGSGLMGGMVVEEDVVAFTAQARDNAQLLQALTKPANWSQTAKLQSEFLQASFQRTAQLGQRYVEVSSTFMTSALAIGWNQAKKVA